MVTLVNSFPVFGDLASHVDKHCIDEPQMLALYPQPCAWELADPVRFEQPVPYSGRGRTWVDLRKSDQATEEAAAASSSSLVIRQASAPPLPYSIIRYIYGYPEPYSRRKLGTTQGPAPKRELLDDDRDETPGVVVAKESPIGWESRLSGDTLAELRALGKIVERQQDHERFLVRTAADFMLYVQDEAESRIAGFHVSFCCALFKLG